MTAPPIAADPIAPPDDPVRVAFHDPAIHRRLLAQARAITRHPGLDAEDLVQEAKTRAWAARATYDPLRSPSAAAWFSGFVTNVARERIRKASKAPRASDELDQRPAAETGSVDLAEQRELLNRYLTRLPDSYREAVKLRYLQELDYPAVAAKLGITPDNARQRVARGLNQLQKLAALEDRS